MELYHGTIREYARHILKEGLRPHPENAFHVNRIPVHGDRVYLARTFYNAKVFAKIRAAYVEMQPGESRLFPEMSDYVPLMKAEDGQPARSDIDTTPIVLSFDVSADKWGEDEDSLSEADETCICTIPPEKVKKIWEFRDGEWIATRRLA